MKIHTEHNPRNAAIIITAVVSLATGFMRAEGRSGISTSAACMAPWQLEGRWGGQSPICAEGHSVSQSLVVTPCQTSTFFLLGCSFPAPCRAALLGQADYAGCVSGVAWPVTPFSGIFRLGATGSQFCLMAELPHYNTWKPSVAIFSVLWTNPVFSERKE